MRAPVFSWNRTISYEPITENISDRVSGLHPGLCTTIHLPGAANFLSGKNTQRLQILVRR